MTPDVNREIIIHDFVNAMHGKLEQGKIEATAAKLRTQDSQSYPATGNIISLVFYLKLQVDTERAVFNGSGGGLNYPGAGALLGTLFTDDQDKLYRETVSFNYVSYTAYFGMTFFDKDHNNIGHFLSGAVTTVVVGVGGGEGSWYIKK